MHDIRFTTHGEDPSSTNPLAQHPLGELLRGSGLMDGMFGGGSALQTLHLSFCRSNVEHSCRGELAPGMLSLEHAPQIVVNGAPLGDGQPRCAVIGRESDRRYAQHGPRHATPRSQTRHATGDASASPTPSNEAAGWVRTGLRCSTPATLARV